MQNFTPPLRKVRKVNTKPTAIDLFAGAGGMTEGLRKAGFQSVLANEYDEMAGLTFQTNHPDVPLLVKDVKTLSGSAHETEKFVR